MKYVSRIFLVIGIVFIIACVAWSANTITFINSAIVTEGEVIDLVEKVTNNDHVEGTVFYPQIVYFTAQGEEIVFESRLGSDPPAYDVGQKVSVLYKANDPYAAEVNTFLSLWFGQIIFAVLGVVFTLLGLFLFRGTKNGPPDMTSYSFELSIDELKYIFSGKKVCPDCGGKLKKESTFEAVAESDATEKSYIKHYVYRCSGCGRMHRINELIHS